MRKKTPRPSEGSLLEKPQKFEFEEALRTLDVNCQFSDNVEELRQNADWFRVLVEDA